jgi:hypothetical protein
MNPKTEAVGSFDTINDCQSTLHHIPENSKFRKTLCFNDSDATVVIADINSTKSSFTLLLTSIFKSFKYIILSLKNISEWLKISLIKCGENNKLYILGFGWKQKKTVTQYGISLNAGIVNK